MTQSSRISFSELLMVVGVLCWTSHSVTGQRLLGCPTSKLHIVSFNETLLPRTLDNIASQIRFLDGPNVPTSFINYGPNHTDVWCAPEVESLPEPLIDIIFTEPVVVVGIISGGYTFENPDAFREYVSSFTLRHTLMSENDQFTLYGANLTGNGETEFLIDDDNVDQLVILKEPFSALRLRLQVLERARSPIVNITCWSMAFLGCTASEAIYEDPAPTTETTPLVVTLTTTITISTKIYATPTPHFDSPSNCMENAASQASQQVVSVAIPIALVTVITVVIVVMVGVIVCIKRGHWKFTSDVGSSSSASAPTEVHYVNTGTREVRITNRNTESDRERTVTIKEVENELYSLNENRRVDSVVYEAIPNPATHNSIQGNGNIINSSPVPVAAATDPPPYSLLAMSSPPPSSAAAGHQTTPPNSQLTQDENYSQIESDVYSEPFSPAKENTAARGRDGFQLSRNESYGSLPSAPQPHYATPTSTLRYIPETHTNFDTDDYEPMMSPTGTVTYDSSR